MHLLFQGICEGGVTGIAIVLYYAFHISPGITNFVLNAILIIVGYKYCEKRSTYLTIFLRSTHFNLSRFNWKHGM